MISSVVNACQVCRTWKRPSNANKLNISLSEHFNDDVQFDLMFYTSVLEPARGQLTIIHLCDAAVRYSRAGFTATKDEMNLTKAISDLWIAFFGPMQTVVLDEEGGMKADGKLVCRSWTSWTLR